MEWISIYREENYFLIFNQDHLLVSLTSIWAVNWSFCWSFNFLFSSSRWLIFSSKLFILSNNSCFCFLLHSSDFSWNLATSSLSIFNSSLVIDNSFSSSLVLFSRRKLKACESSSLSESGLVDLAFKWLQKHLFLFLFNLPHFSHHGRVLLS